MHVYIYIIGILSVCEVCVYPVGLSVYECVCVCVRGGGESAGV